MFKAAAFACAFLLCAIRLAGAAADSPFGSWLAEDIRGAGVIAGVRTTLDILPSGETSGSSGCNRFHGAAKVAGAEIAFGPLASSQMGCPGPVGDQERKFFKALEDVRQWTRDEQRRLLSLRDADGREILRLSETK
ncbi:META domain-containing protein [Methylocella silvestris]|uniref:META domain-containing protein n=1 Tax=Methylocella silvestris TaxID=199596 RepID=A0A2J7TEI1_METSI|nr:META domain-containing protein [Methylocella silvestris]